MEGNNQENLAFPSGLCAERVALFHVGALYGEDEIEAIFIYGEGDLIEKTRFVTPCGGCRQVMMESVQRQKKSFQVFMVNQNLEILNVEDVMSLLPLTFGENLF